MRVVLDTNVLVAAARSKLGASFAIVSTVPSDKFEVCLSVALFAEWQDVLSRPQNLPPGRTVAEARRFLRYLASQSHLQMVYFRYRPFLPDADDDMVLEVADASGAEYIVTHNVSDFVGINLFGVTAVTPRDFLKLIRALP